MKDLIAALEEGATLCDLGRGWLRIAVPRCSKEKQQVFKRMYSHNNLEASIDSIVANLPDEKIAWAMEQVANTLTKNLKPRTVLEGEKK